MRLLALVLLLSSAHALADVLMPVKEQVKLELWHEGVSLNEKTTPASAPQGQALPEEISRVLNKFQL